MKLFNRSPQVIFLLFFLCILSCTAFDDDYKPDKDNKIGKLSVNEAKNVFENSFTNLCKLTRAATDESRHAHDCGSPGCSHDTSGQNLLDKEIIRRGLPGEYTPQWNKAKVVDSKYMWTVEVPVISEYNYAAVHKDSDIKHPVRVGQKIMVLKNKEMGCVIPYFITTIPTTGYYLKNKRKTYSHNIPSDKFSGIVIFRALNDMVVQVTQYVDGEPVNAVHLFKDDIRTESVSERYMDIANSFNMFIAPSLQALSEQTSGPCIGCGYWIEPGYSHDCDDPICVYACGVCRKQPCVCCRFCGKAPDSCDCNEPMCLSCWQKPCICGHGGEPRICNNCGLYLGDCICDNNGGGGGGGGSNNNGNDGDVGKPTLCPTCGTYCYGHSNTTAPDASRIFRNSSMSNDTWKNVEKMVNTITSYPIGKSLYDGLVGKLNGKTIILKFVDGDRGRFLAESTTIELGTYSASNVLFHEMFHCYQLYSETMETFIESKMNIEIEARIAQLIYLRSTPEYKPGFPLYDEHIENDVWRLTEILTELIDENGRLINSTYDGNASFDTFLINTGEYLKSTKTYENYIYNFDRTGDYNIRNIAELIKNY